MIAVWLLAACGDSGDVAVAPPSGLDGGWVAVVVREPAKFQALVDGDARDGWIALHKNDWTAAVAAGGVPARRALDELVTFHAVLADLSADTWLLFGATWERRGTLPKESVFPRLVRLAATDAGDKDAVAHWDGVPAAPMPPALAEREQLHAKLLGGEGDLDALRRSAHEPLFTENAEGVTRPFYDPIVHRSLSEGYRRRAATVPAPATPLEGQLFSASLGADDAQTLVSLGVTFPASGDVEDTCREAVRALDSRLDAWRLQLGSAAGDDGRALLNELRLVEGTRSRLLVSQAVAALAADQPRCAVAYAELARDHEAARSISPVNSPTLFAVLAAGNLRTGRAREALDALEVLTGPYPEVVALDETVGDLTVLQGIDRAGDSREN
ncbi:MAG: hypothetical protein ACOZNI_01935 [Myxococcota bacterium]